MAHFTAPPAADGTDFWDEQRRNRRRRRVFLGAWMLLAVGVGWFLGRSLERVTDPDAWAWRLAGIETVRPWYADRALQMAGAFLLLAWSQIRRLRSRGDAVLLSMVDARPCDDARLQSAMEQVSVAAVHSTPRVWIAETDHANAFTWGLDPFKSTIVVTRGLLGRLTRQELAAVLSHEMAHIRSGDAQLRTLLLGLMSGLRVVARFALGPLHVFLAAWKGKSPWAWLAGAGLLSIGVLDLVVGWPLALKMAPVALGTFALWDLFRGERAWRRWQHREDSRRRLGGKLSRYDAMVSLWFFVPVAMALAPTLIALALMVPPSLLLLRLAVSREREFDADATALELGADNMSLMSALCILRGDPVPPAGLRGALHAVTIVPMRRGTHERRASELILYDLLGSTSPKAVLWLDRIRDLFETYPALTERIARVEADMPHGIGAAAPTPDGWVRDASGRLAVRVPSLD